MRWLGEPQNSKETRTKNFWTFLSKKQVKIQRANSLEAFLEKQQPFLFNKNEQMRETKKVNPFIQPVQSKIEEAKQSQRLNAKNHGCNFPTKVGECMGSLMM